MGNSWNTSPGASFVPAYQVSGIPFVTSSAATEVTATPICVKLPAVSRFISVFNLHSTAQLRVGFSNNGIQGNGLVSGSSAPGAANYFIVGGGSSTGVLDIRCKEIWFMRDAGDSVGFSLMAGLTGIKPSEFPILTGSSGIKGVG
jgi:hypothetical protein